MKCDNCGEDIEGKYKKVEYGNREFNAGFFENYIETTIKLCEKCYEDEEKK